METSSWAIWESHVRWKRLQAPAICSGKEMLEAITACKLSKEREIEQTEVYEDECWDDYDGETIGS